MYLQELLLENVIPKASDDYEDSYIPSTAGERRYHIGPGNLAEKLQLASYCATFNPLSHCSKEMPVYELSGINGIERGH